MSRQKVVSYLFKLKKKDYEDIVLTDIGEELGCNIYCATYADHRLYVLTNVYEYKHIDSRDIEESGISVISAFQQMMGKERIQKEIAWNTSRSYETDQGLDVSKCKTRPILGGVEVRAQCCMCESVEYKYKITDAEIFNLKTDNYSDGIQWSERYKGWIIKGSCLDPEPLGGVLHEFDILIYQSQLDEPKDFLVDSKLDGVFTKTSLDG